MPAAASDHRFTLPSVGLPADPGSRRRWIIGSLAFFVIYSGVLLAFALDNVRGDVAVRGTDDPPAGGVSVDAMPRSIDASARR